MPAPALLTGSGARKLHRVCILVVLGGVLWYILGVWQKPQHSHLLQGHNADTKWMCRKYPDTGDIAVIIKTGAQEGLKNLPATLSTCLSCVKDVIILSDLEQKFDDIKIHDVLSRFAPAAMDGNQEFDIYWKQKSLQAEGREDEIPSLSTILAAPRDWRTAGRTAGWALDKYKWLHMLDMAWDLQPNREWYLFVETDTYLSWPNLKRWLRTLDSKRKYYLGLAIQKSDDREPLYFAQGGSGILLSGTLLEEFAVHRRGIANQYEPRMHEWWAGDFTLADVLYDEMDIHVTQIWPMVNQHPPRSAPLWPGAWCRAALAMHHLTAGDFEEMFELEKELGFSRLLLRDVYGKVYPHGLPPDRLDWSNIADAHEYGVPIEKQKLPPLVDPNRDFDSCREACEIHQDCFQFSWRNTTVVRPGEEPQYLNSCVLSNAFRLGHPKLEQDFGENADEYDTYRRFHSGWMPGRITNWTKAHWACEEHEEWSLKDIGW